MKEIDEGICGDHIGDRTLAHKALRHEYKEVRQMLKVCANHQPAAK